MADNIRTTPPLGTRVLLRRLRILYDAGEVGLIDRIRTIEAINAREEEAYANYLSMFLVPERLVLPVVAKKT